jgi:hypothetical protein
MRALVMFALLCMPWHVMAQHIYGGMDAGYGIVQIRPQPHDEIDTFAVANGALFLGYRMSSGMAMELAYLQAREKMSGGDGRFYRIKMNVVDVGLVLHSTELLPGFYIRPSLGMLNLDVEEHGVPAGASRKESDAMFSFGFGYEASFNRYVALRIAHTTHFSWRGERMNGVKVGLKFNY